MLASQPFGGRGVGSPSPRRQHGRMVEHATVIRGIKRDKTHPGGWVEHEPTGRAVVRCTCGLHSGIVAEALAAQIADDHRRTTAEARA